ncbi:MAG: hypothetical protein V1909_00595 [Candidatus Micrarchaeota archaeon]
MDKHVLQFFSVWFVAVTLICVIMISDLRRSVELEASKPGFSYTVKGCAENNINVETRGLLQDDRGPGLIISGNQIRYYRAINHLCCRKAVIRSEISTSEINIYEEWSGRGCKCMCFSEIEAVSERLPPGQYSVTVYETGTKPVTGEPMEKTTILTKELFINAK